MKINSFVCITAFAFLLAASALRATTVRISLHVPAVLKDKQAEFTLGLAAPNSVADFADFQHSKSGSFTLELAPGAYKLGLFHPFCERTTYYLQVGSNNNPVTLDATLAPIAFDRKITSVGIIGHFNAWNFSAPLPLEKDTKTGIWRLPSSKVPANTTSFAYLVNGNIRTPNPYQQLRPVGKQGYFLVSWGNTQDPTTALGNTEVIFDPSLFPKTKIPAQYQITGSPAGFNDMMQGVEAVDYRIAIYSPANRLLESGSDRAILQTYEDVQARYDAIRSLHPDISFPIVEELELLVEALQIERGWESRNKLPVSSPLYRDSFLVKAYRLLTSTPKQDWTVHGGKLASQLFYLDNYLSQSDLQGSVIPFSFFRNTAVAWKKNGASDDFCAGLLYHQSRDYKFYNTAKCERMLTQLSEQYKHTTTYKSNQKDIDITLTSLRLKPGVDMPNFSFTTLDNQSLSVEALKGKYVFYYFWGNSFNDPKDLSAIKQLQENYGSDKLLIVGIPMIENMEKIREQAAKKGFTHPQIWVETPENINIPTLLGFNRMPCSFLVDPNGKIVLRDVESDQFFNKISWLVGQKTP